MDFQIERLIVWPKKEDFEPREVVFKKNCVNVLSGDSRTGKSAVVSIIDYCLGSHDFSVPGGKVRENAAWFGIVVVIGNERMLLARRNPDAQKKGTGDFFEKALQIDEKIPSKIEEKNTDVETIVSKLSQIVGLEPIRREDYGSENAKLSFRDICHLLFQPQDVVASRLQMFDKMNIYHSKEKLANWFNFVLGVETVQDILDKVELDKIRRALEAIARERERDTNKLGEWINQLRGELMNARNYGLISDDVAIPEVEDKKALLELAEKTVQNAKTNKPPKSEWAINREIKKLENLYLEARAEHSRAEKRVGTLEELTESISKVGIANIEKRDRLQISKWINANWKPAKICPVCGGASHPAAHAEVEKICRVVEEIEKVKNSIDEFPAATLDELMKRRNEAEAARKKAEDIYEQLNAVKEQKVEIGNFIEEEKKKATILEGLRRTLELNTATLGGSRLDVEEAKLKAQKDQITKRYNQYAIKAKAEQAYQAICHITHERFCSMDSEDKAHVPPSVEEPDGDNGRIAELEDEMAAKDEILAELAAEKVSAEDRLLKAQEELAESKNKISRLENEIAQLKAKQAREEEDSPRSPENAAKVGSAQGRVNAQEDEKKPTRAILEASLAIEEVFPGELREIVLSVLKEGCEIAQNAGRERRVALLSQLLDQNTPSRELDSRKNELRQILKDAGSFADVHTIRALEKIGFRLISGKKHWKLEYGNVRMPIAKTPSDYRSNLNSANAIVSKCF